MCDRVGGYVYLVNFVVLSFVNGSNVDLCGLFFFEFFKFIFWNRDIDINGINI